MKTNIIAKKRNMSIEIKEVSGIVPAMIGMRNPMNSWRKNDTIELEDGTIVIGKNDMKLAQKLISAGSEHRKFLRQIVVWIDITMPRYWWSEFDTYMGIPKNSCSTMHKLFDKNKEISLSDFDVPSDRTATVLKTPIKALNELKALYFESNKSMDYLLDAKSILPESYLQKRTVMVNYESLRNIYTQRKNHRLKDTWGTLIEAIKLLPYADDFILSE